MTEYELADVISSYAVQGGTFFTIWLTVLSAYALVAYTAGKALSPFQVLWLNILYLFASILTIFGFYGSFNTQVFYIQLIRELNPISPHVMIAEAAFGIAIVAVIGTLLTLLFMWGVRHPKTE
jgi:hypothetical protein